MSVVFRCRVCGIEDSKKLSSCPACGSSDSFVSATIHDQPTSTSVSPVLTPHPSPPKPPVSPIIRKPAPTPIHRHPPPKPVYHRRSSVDWGRLIPGLLKFAAVIVIVVFVIRNFSDMKDDLLRVRREFAQPQKTSQTSRSTGSSSTSSSTRSSSVAINGRDSYLAGRRAIIIGTLERNPGSSVGKYKIITSVRTIAINHREAEQYVHKTVRLEVEYTGEGRQFKILKMQEFR